MNKNNLMKQWLIGEGLTERQAQSTILICKGLSFEEIANQLGISVVTVKYLAGQSYLGLKVKSKSELIVKCWKKFPLFQEEAHLWKGA